MAATRARGGAGAPRAILRAGLYERVSSEEQVQGYSLDAQDRAGRLYCAAHGWEIAAVYRDEGRSARADDLGKRPEFARMLADADAGRLDVVVVHKLDRFARNLRVTLETLERLEKAGVGFVSISEQMDFTTPIGKVILATLAAFAQYYSDNLSTETKKGKAERKAQGLYNGLLPFGVAKGSGGLPVPDRAVRSCDVASRREIVPADGLALAFELAAAGTTDREVAQALTGAGYRTSGNRGANAFTKDTVREMLQNRFYLGELPDGEGGWVPGKHASLVDPALFDRAARARERNAKRPRRVRTQARSPWALSGLAACVCGRPMTACGHQGAKQRVQCAGRTQGSGCDAPTFYAAVVEDQIAGFLGEHFAVPAADRERLTRAWRLAQGGAVDAGADRRRIAGKLERLKLLFLEGDLDRAAYQAQKGALQAELAALPAEPEVRADAGGRLAGYLADVAAAWRVATPEERNKLARELFSGVVIDNRTAVAVVPRPDLVPFFEVAARQGTGDETHGRKRRDSNPRSQP